MDSNTTSPSANARTVNFKARLALIQRIVFLQILLLIVATIMVMIATTQSPARDSGKAKKSADESGQVESDGNLEDDTSSLEEIPSGDGLLGDDASSGVLSPDNDAKDDTKLRDHGKTRIENTNLGFFWFGFLAGIFGASIALLRKVTKGESIDAYLTSKSWTITLCPFLYGGIMAGVAYFMMISGIVSGESGGGLFTTNLFPSFDGGVATDNHLLSMYDFRTLRPATVRDAAKALIWCFLAGFSESFVTGMLSSLEMRGTGADPDDVIDLDGE